MTTMSVATGLTSNTTAYSGTSQTGTDSTTNSQFQATVQQVSDAFSNERGSTTTNDKASFTKAMMAYMSDELRQLPPGSGSVPTGTATTKATTPGLTVNGNTIDTGKYLISASNSDHATLTITDKATGKTMTVHGDPHVELSDGYKGEFQNESMHISLDDGTQLEITPTQLDKGVAYMSSVAVSRNGTSAKVDFHDGQSTSTALDSTASTSQHLGDVSLDATGGLDDVKVGGQQITAGFDSNLDHFAGASDSAVSTTGGQGGSTAVNTSSLLVGTENLTNMSNTVSTLTQNQNQKTVA